MVDEEREEEARARPRVVDKRVSARPRQTPTPPTPPGTQAEDPPAPAVEAPAPVAPASSDPGRAAVAEDLSEEERVPGTEPIWTPEQEAEARRIVEEIAQVPARDWVTDVAVRLANIAGVKLDGGQLQDAQLAIDALAGIVDASAGRLGDAESPLRQTLAQVRMAYTQLAASPPTHGT